MVELDPKIELKYFEDRSDKLQKAILQMRTDIQNIDGEKARLVSLEADTIKRLEEANSQIIRIKAKIEEAIQRA
jgi:hypothetical protein